MVNHGGTTKSNFVEPKTQVKGRNGRVNLYIAYNNQYVTLPVGGGGGRLKHGAWALAGSGEEQKSKEYKL
eukprot:3765611-Ditylum_brightwellii.AAC.1